MAGQNIIDDNKNGSVSSIPNAAADAPNPVRDPDELTDQELEWVVGGTDPEFARNQFEQSQKPIEPPVPTS